MSLLWIVSRFIIGTTSFPIYIGKARAHSIIMLEWNLSAIQYIFGTFYF